MTYNNENALAEVKNFTLPAMIESDFSNEELSEDFDGLQMSFQRVKIPAADAAVTEGLSVGSSEAADPAAAVTEWLAGIGLSE